MWWKLWISCQIFGLQIWSTKPNEGSLFGENDCFLEVVQYFLFLLESCFFLLFWRKCFSWIFFIIILFFQCWLFVINRKNAVFCFGFLEGKLYLETTVCSLLYAKSYCSIVTSQHNHVNKLSLWINEGECFINNNDKNGNGFPFRSCSWQLTQGGTDMKSVRLQAASR